MNKANKHNDLGIRFEENPLLYPHNLLPSDTNLKIECLLNPGAFTFKGKVWILVRVAENAICKKGIVTFPIMDENGKIQLLEISANDPNLDKTDPRVYNYYGDDYLTTISHLRLLSSADGIHFQEEPQYPCINGTGENETYGIEDCRVTQIDDTYYLTYTAVSKNGVSVGMMSTKDWKTMNRYGLILPPHNKDCAIFSSKINGRYCMLHRPSSVELGGNYIWYAESDDMQHWGKHRCIAQTRKGMWDSQRIGAGASPIKTESGWLEIYHGADENNRYCLGAMLLDLDEPFKVIARSETPIMQPQEKYETEGFFGDVIFTNGHIVDGDEITVYYGAADEVIGAAKFSVKQILKTLNI